MSSHPADELISLKNPDAPHFELGIEICAFKFSIEVDWAPSPEMNTSGIVE